MSAQKNAARKAALLMKWAASFKKLLAATAATPSNAQDPNTKETKTYIISSILNLSKRNIED